VRAAAAEGGGGSAAAGGDEDAEWDAELEAELLEHQARLARMLQGLDGIRFR
jgi:hypothetical protein